MVSGTGGNLGRVRTFVVAIATAVVVALAGGCTGEVASSDSDDRRSQTPSPRPGDTAVIDSEACEQVRTGIAAFNVGQYDETVARFEEALPLAEEQDDGSVPASELIEAVRYYAELDAELYPEAARSSPEFAKYKAITLGQCVPAVGETTQSPGVDV